MPRPCRTDISYERWNNYTGRVWGESRSAEGKRQFYAAGAPPSLATRWQPSFLLTIRPTKSTACPVFHGNQRCRRSKTLFNVPEMKYIADTLSVAVRFSFQGRAGVDGGGRSAINRRSVRSYLPRHVIVAKWTTHYVWFRILWPISQWTGEGNILNGLMVRFNRDGAAFFSFLWFLWYRPVVLEY